MSADRLVDVPVKPWRLSEATKEAGRRGIAAARAELAAHRPPEQERSA